MKTRSNQERLPSRLQGLARVEAWNRLVQAEGRAASLATIARLLDGPWDGPCGNFVIVPASALAAYPQSRQRPSGAALTLKPGRLPCEVTEVYADPAGGWRSLTCIVLKDWTADEIAPLMPGFGLDLVLVADDVGLALLNPDGRREALEGKVNANGVLAAWREWSRRRYPDGPTLHRLQYPVSGWTSNFAQRRAEGLRLGAAYGPEAVEAAVARIMAGVEPAVAVPEMAAGK